MLTVLFAAVALCVRAVAECQLCKDVSLPIQATPHSYETKVSFDVERVLQNASDLYVYVDLRHNYLGNLVIHLEHEGVEYRLLQHWQCADRDDLRAYFHEEGTEDMCYDLDVHSYEKVYDSRPKDPMAAFNSLPKNGRWTVTFSDTHTTNYGTVNRVCIGWFGDCRREDWQKACSHVTRDARVYALDKCQKESDDSIAVFKYNCSNNNNNMSALPQVGYYQFSTLDDCLLGEAPLSATVLEDGFDSVVCDGALADGCDLYYDGFDLNSHSCGDSLDAATVRHSHNRVAVHNVVLEVCVDDTRSNSSYAFGHVWQSLALRFWDSLGCHNEANDTLVLANGCYDDFALDKYSQSDAVFLAAFEECSHIQTDAFGLDGSWAMPEAFCFYSLHFGTYVRFVCPSQGQHSWHFVEVYAADDWHCTGPIAEVQTNDALEVLCTAKRCREEVVVLSTANGYFDDFDKCDFAFGVAQMKAAGIYMEQPLFTGHTCHYSEARGFRRALFDDSTLELSGFSDTCAGTDGMEIEDSITGQCILDGANSHYVKIERGNVRNVRIVPAPNKACRVCQPMDAVLEFGLPPVTASFEVLNVSGNASNFYVILDVIHDAFYDLQAFVNHSEISRKILQTCGNHVDLRLYFHDAGRYSDCFSRPYTYYEDVYDLLSEESLEVYNTVPKSGKWTVLVEDIYSDIPGNLKRVCIGWFGQCQLTHDLKSTLPPSSTSLLESTATLPQTTDSGFQCENGCVISDDSLDDDKCDCGECEDEQNWDCGTCEDCPTTCGQTVHCVRQRNDGWNPRGCVQIIVGLIIVAYVYV